MATACPAAKTTTSHIFMSIGQWLWDALGVGPSATVKNFLACWPLAAWCSSRCPPCAHSTCRSGGSGKTNEGSSLGQIEVSSGETLIHIHSAHFPCSGELGCTYTCASDMPFATEDLEEFLTSPGRHSDDADRADPNISNISKLGNGSMC